MYLHEDREVFKDIIEQAADDIGRTPIVIEKDYYVTQILRLLAKQLKNCVFKGGTSLSMGFHVIDRFSEDIDISMVILEFCNDSFYEEDYQSITSYFADDFIPYSEVVDQMREIAQENWFS